ncbi:hypothetical protein [Pseudogulbenkiania subflava]|uniref:hypothetical protein n=1 Tax=Pseudogulbenkiania subflava TaxID=451637 RepID=UPI00117AAE32|nr:hypothetical protein [Pseudogulbenkiania subflava]
MSNANKTPELSKLERFAKRLRENSDIYKIDPKYGTIRLDASNPKTVKEIQQVAKKFFKAIHNK